MTRRQHEPVTPDRATEHPTRQLQTWIREQAHRLYGGYSGDTGTAVAQLARLRRPAGPGSEIGLDGWELMSDLPPACLGGTDVPSAWERAAFDTLGLFARHQQSLRDQSMHVPDVRLGQALSRLRTQAPSEAALTRRFTEMGAATSYSASIRHLAGLVTMLRGPRIGLDYGLLAGDLVHLQSPARRATVRFRWGRDFFTSQSTTADAESNGDNPEDPAEADIEGETA